MKRIHTNTIKNINTQTIHFIDIQIQTHKYNQEHIHIFTNNENNTYNYNQKHIYIFINNENDTNNTFHTHTSTNTIKKNIFMYLQTLYLYIQSNHIYIYIIKSYS
jgi:hypothetical protein